MLVVGKAAASSVNMGCMDLLRHNLHRRQCFARCQNTLELDDGDPSTIGWIADVQPFAPLDFHEARHALVGGHACQEARFVEVVRVGIGEAMLDTGGALPFEECSDTGPADTLPAISMADAQYVVKAGRR